MQHRPHYRAQHHAVPRCPKGPGHCAGFGLWALGHGPWGTGLRAWAYQMQHCGGKPSEDPVADHGRLMAPGWACSLGRAVPSGAEQGLCGAGEIGEKGLGGLLRTLPGTHRTPRVITGVFRGSEGKSVKIGCQGPLGGSGAWPSSLGHSMWWVLARACPTPVPMATRGHLSLGESAVC